MVKEKANKSGDRRKQMVALLIMIILIIALIVVLAMMVVRQMRQSSSESSFEDLRPKTIVEDTLTMDNPESVEDTESGAEPVTIPVPNLHLDWDTIVAQDSNIYAWIYVPNTNVNYPVLQHPTDDTYYLKHNLDGSTGYPGCIYTELVNSKDFTDTLTVIYGHNMRNGTMFKSLHNFEDEDFFDANPYFYIYLPDGTRIVYEIYSAGRYSNTHIANTYGVNSYDGLQEFLDSVEDYATSDRHTRTLPMSEEDHVVVLSTCIGNSSYRYIVQGLEIAQLEGDNDSDSVTE